MRSIVAIVAVSAAAAPAWATAIDFLISQDGSPNHKLQIQKPTQYLEPYPLDLVEDGPLAGYYASIEPGWDGLGADMPAQGMFGLLALKGVALQQVSADAGFALFDGLLNQILVDPADKHIFEGESEGNPDILWHEHLRFAIEPGAAVGQFYNVTFKLTDVNGQQADSDAFTLTFVTVPEPATLGMIGAAGLALLRRR